MDDPAADPLYVKLRVLALECAREIDPGEILTPGAVMHKAYQRLLRAEPADGADRDGFQFLAAAVMRRVLVDDARRAGDRQECILQTRAAADEVLAMDRQLEDLARHAPQKAQIVELRYFGGFELKDLPPAGDITRLISEWQRGDKAAENALFEALYQRLHSRALKMLRTEPQGQSMGATALVHEAYLRFRRAERLEISDRDHFLNMAAKVMRQILVDRARERLSPKHGGGLERVDHTDNLVRTDGDADEILAVDRALEGLKLRKPRQAQLVELKYYGGYTLGESAAIMGVSEKTAQRDWNEAKLWLAEAIEGAAPPL